MATAPTTVVNVLLSFMRLVLCIIGASKLFAQRQKNRATTVKGGKVLPQIIAEAKIDRWIRAMTKVHLDTDLGGDIDDLCALAMLLRWPSVTLTGITVVGDTNGIRTGYTRYALGLEGSTEIPVAAGADTAQGFYRSELPPQDRRYWPAEAVPSPNSAGQAIELLKQSIEDGATIIGIGPFTNLYLLDKQYPGILARANLYLMGGFIYPLRPGYPNWKNEFDFNVQVDIKSAEACAGQLQSYPDSYFSDGGNRIKKVGDRKIADRRRVGTTNRTSG